MHQDFNVIIENNTTFDYQLDSIINSGSFCLYIAELGMSISTGLIMGYITQQSFMFVYAVVLGFCPDSSSQCYLYLILF